MSLAQSEIKKFLGSIQPFKALPASDLNAVVSKVREKSFSKDDSIFSEGDPADSVWVIYKGRVQVFKYISDGRSFAVESLGPGELFGTLCRMGGNGRSYPCTAVAAAETTALQILDKVFIEYYMKNPGMMQGVCSLCSDRLKDVQDLRCMGQESAHVKLANILCRLHQVHGDTLPFTKKEISELIGVALETTFRELSKLQKKGYLQSQRGKILIKKPDAIRALIENA